MTNTMSLNSIGIGGLPIRDDVNEIDDNSSLVLAGRRYEMMQMKLMTINPWHQRAADTK